MLEIPNDIAHRLIEIGQARQYKTGVERGLSNKPGGDDPGDIRHSLGVIAQYSFNVLLKETDPFPTVEDHYEDSQGWDLSNIKGSYPIRTYGTQYKTGKLPHRTEHTQPDLCYVLGTVGLIIDGEAKQNNNSFMFSAWLKQALLDKKEIAFEVRFKGFLWGNEMKQYETKQYWEDGWPHPTYAIPQGRLTKFPNLSRMIGIKA